MSSPRGYHTRQGYVGFLPDGSWMLFSGDQDYYEYLDVHFANVFEAADSIDESPLLQLEGA